MLESVELKEVYKVINKKVYAVINETGSKRAVDPCDTRVELARENETLLAEKEQLEQKLAQVTKKLTDNTRLDNEIAALGYCKKDKPIYKKIDGITMYRAGKPVIDSYTHQSDCPNRGC